MELFEEKTKKTIQQQTDTRMHGLPLTAHLSKNKTGGEGGAVKFSLSQCRINLRRKISPLPKWDDARAPRRIKNMAEDDPPLPNHKKSPIQERQKKGHLFGERETNLHSAPLRNTRNICPCRGLTINFGRSRGRGGVDEGKLPISRAHHKLKPIQGPAELFTKNKSINFSNLKTLNTEIKNNESTKLLKSSTRTSVEFSLQSAVENKGHFSPK